MMPGMELPRTGPITKAHLEAVFTHGRLRRWELAKNLRKIHSANLPKIHVALDTYLRTHLELSEDGWLILRRRNPSP